MVLSSTRIVSRLDVVDGVVRASGAHGLNMAAERLLALATPLTPYLDGGLQGGYGIHQATAETIEEGAQLQNSAEYAAYQHEGGDATRHINEAHRARDTHPAAQSKFVEQPMRESRDELYGLIAASIREGLR